MFAHKSYLKLGGFEGTDFMSLVKGGYELVNLDYSFQQGTDRDGKPQTDVTAGMFRVTIPTIPSKEIVEWALNPRKYHKGVIVVLDDANVPQQKILFDNGACTSFDIDYNREGSAYVSTVLTISSEIFMFGDAMDFNNFWTI